MSLRRAVDMVVPAGIADPRRPSGGNTYDRRLREGLAVAGWSVRTREVAGDWPRASHAARRALVQELDRVPDGAVVLVDGLVASACPEVWVPAGRRLRTVLLVHMPLGLPPDRVVRDRESAVLRACVAVVAASDWTRRWLLDAYRLDPRRVHVARPGVDPAAAATGSRDGGAIISVGAVTHAKGHDLLLRALTRVARLAWRCSCVGPLSRSPDFVAGLRRDVRASGLDERLRLLGPRTGEDLDEVYASADVLVHASRAETYGMVVVEALARGLPVIAHDVGGLSEALGTGTDGDPPGMLVPTADVDALAEALRCWLTDPEVRGRLRASAADRRTRLAGWGDTTDRVVSVLEAVAA